jgi:hypothetical protein
LTGRNIFKLNSIIKIFVISALFFSHPLNAQDKNVSIQAGINTTDKNSSDLEGMGLGGSLELSVGMNKYVDITFGAGFFIQNLFDSSNDLPMIPLLGGLRIKLQKLKIEAGDGFILPYIGGGLGYVIPEERSKYILNNGGLAASVLVGSLYNLNEKMGIDINIKMNGFYWGSSDHTAYADVLYCLNAGIYFKL